MGGPGGPPHGWEPLGEIMTQTTLECILSAILGGLFAFLMMA